MLDIILSNRFKKDLKLAAKRGYPLELLDEVVQQLARQEELAQKFKDHELSGNFAGFRECHIQPDWLLVYRVESSELMLFLSRTGTLFRSLWLTVHERLCCHQQSLSCPTIPTMYSQVMVIL